MSRAVRSWVTGHKKENKIKNAGGGDIEGGGYEDTGLIPVSPVRATDVNGWPCLDHRTTPFARNGPVQEAQANP